VTELSRELVDARQRVTGSLPLVLNHTVPGMVHGKVVRSMVPHGAITGIETDAALAEPGVLAVITGADLAAMPIDPWFGAMRADQPVLAMDKVRYAGDPVAIVVAEQRWQAVAAAELVYLDYEEFDSVVDPVAATSPDAPQVHDGYPGNDCGDWRLEKGDVDAAFASAAHVYRGTYRTPIGSHVPMEPHVCVAAWPTTERLEVWTSAQAAHAVRAGLRGIFGIEDVSVRVLNVGGAYGSKGQIKIEPMVACASMIVGRPVRIELDRDEVFATIGRSSATVHLATAVDDDGRIVARDIDVVYNAGAYAVMSPYASGQGLVRAPGPYRIPHIRARSRAVYTNSVPTGPFRGAMTGQVCLAYELQLDEIADDLGIDRVEIRHRNLLRDGDEYATSEVMHDMHYEELLRETAAAIGWGERSEASAPSRRRGKGLGLTIKSTITPSRSEARLLVDADGTITLRSASTEMGQGASATLTILSAEALGVAPDAITRHEVDTDDDPFDTTTASSRTTFSMGAAIADAGRKVRERIDELIRSEDDHGSVPEHRDGGTVGPDGRWRSYAEILKEAGIDRIEGHGIFQSVGGLRECDPQDVRGSTSVHWHQGSSAVEVEVDVETGHVSIVRAVGGAYVGRAISPTRVDQQNIGCMVMGLGPALFEELTYDDGQPTNPNLSDYMIPSILDVPPAIGSVIVESDEPDPELHGAGEMAIPAVPGAVASAIHDAVGVWLRQVPLTPERVLRALAESDSTSTRELGATT
jgi:CO/xanthine dehydrogenase Mo-binding subunit